MKNNKYGENEHCRTRSSRLNDSCRYPYQAIMLRVVIKVSIFFIIFYQIQNMFLFPSINWIYHFLRLLDFSIGDISLLGFFERKSYKPEAQPLQPNLRELTRVIHQLWAVLPQQYLHRYII